LHPLLAEIAAKHCFPLSDDDVIHLAKHERELLIDALLQELAETGLESDDEPNLRGLEIEATIDFMQSMAEQPDASPSSQPADEKR